MVVTVLLLISIGFNLYLFYQSDWYQHERAKVRRRKEAEALEVLKNSWREIVYEKRERKVASPMSFAEVPLEDEET